jgi:hypothetical protein
MEVQSPRTGHTRAAIDPAATAGQPAASWFVPRVFGTASCEKSTYIAITRQTLAASAWPAADNGEVIVGVLQVPRDPRPVQAEVGHSGRTSNSPAARKCFVVDSKHRCLGQLGIQHLHQRAGGQRTRPRPSARRSRSARRPCRPGSVPCRYRRRSDTQSIEQRRVVARSHDRLSCGRASGVRCVRIINPAGILPDGARLLQVTAADNAPGSVPSHVEQRFDRGFLPR